MVLRILGLNKPLAMKKYIPQNRIVPVVITRNVSELCAAVINCSAITPVKDMVSINVLRNCTYELAVTV